jgi:DNA polymerase (family 10)
VKNNKKLSQLLEETAKMLNFKGENFYRIRAFNEAAETVKHLEENIEDIASNKKLEDLPGIGAGMAARIEEYLKTGDFSEHQKLVKEIPDGVLQIMEIPGVGPKKAKVLFDQLKIKDIEGLEAGIKAEKLRGLEGFGEKSEQKILDGIDKMKKFSERILLSRADEIVAEVLKQIKAIKGVQKAEPAGSVRRRKETIGDIDILYVADRSGKDIGKEFTAGLDETDIIALGEKKTSFIWDKTCQVDLRIIVTDQWGAAMQYFTGSKEHNVEFRKYAVRNNIKVNEYGVWKNEKRIAGETEEEVYDALGMPYVEPEMRENLGEIDAALKKKLPNLIKESDIVGDTHVHSIYSDGKSKIEESVKEARNRGYKWIAICDHSQSLKIANGLEPDRLNKKIDEIKKLNDKYEINILCGSEVDIKKDGELDYPDEILKKLDLVIAAIHTGFSEPEDVITARVIKAMENPYVNIIAHPTGRLINEREAYALDIHKVIKQAAKTGTAIEINAHPKRLDLYYYLVKEAKEKGVKLAIGTDAHHISEMKLMNYGIDVARRGWLEKNNLINTMKKKELFEFLENKAK